MSFFFKKYSSKKTTNVSDDRLVVEYEDIDTDEIINEELEIDDSTAEDDNGHGLYNYEVAATLHEQAIQIMHRQSIIVSAAEMKEALQLMPKVSGLAHHINDSPTLCEEFDQLVQRNNQLDGSKWTLDRHVATRWNSDFQCLLSCKYFQKEVEQITAISKHGLTSYQLSANQWSLLKDLIDALEIFKEATDLFSQKDVPLIMDVLPIFFDIWLSLTDILMDKKNRIRPILKVAAKAALLMIEKYTILTSESEVYYIAIVMCPDQKLDWFKERDYHDEQIEEIKDMVVK
ncbi:hypothetical protein BDQ17DRAFT_1470795 [Cyathus striatus]|nr:hypothetical protein BDQ17DRAFT_1470795 [Cyathus striatus]